MKPREVDFDTVFALIAPTINPPPHLSGRMFDINLLEDQVQVHSSSEDSYHTNDFLSKGSSNRDYEMASNDEEDNDTSTDKSNEEDETTVEHQMLMATVTNKVEYGIPCVIVI